ncbi:hypothetical protein BKA66DRAFT_468442 [Pyrenochaeta sp. MPI-SDFR-AT-0127]|nr:hypothetical protein BKA66DRAFT_468442 [Pyrenochaeta sp. MPI-SDFR-AT-0127]
MRTFGTEIGDNRSPGGELSERQRDFIISQAEAGVRTKDIAETIGCTQRCVQKTIARWHTTHSNASRPRQGRTPILSTRTIRRLSRVVKNDPTIKLHQLVEDAGKDTAHDASPKVSKKTIQRHVCRPVKSQRKAKRRPKNQ